MSAAGDAEVLGVSQGDIFIHRPHTDVLVALAPDAMRQVWAQFGAEETERGPAQRIYIELDRVQGSMDASSLMVQLRMSGSAESDPSPPFVAGSVGLYGLRRASLASAERPRPGLGFLIDVTAFFRDAARTAKAPPPDEIIVSISLRPELPLDAAIAIGRLALLREQYESPATRGS